MLFHFQFCLQQVKFRFIWMQVSWLTWPLQNIQLCCLKKKFKVCLWLASTQSSIFGKEWEKTHFITSPICSPLKMRLYVLSHNHLLPLFHTPPSQHFGRNWSLLPSIPENLEYLKRLYVFCKLWIFLFIRHTNGSYLAIKPFLLRWIYCNSYPVQTIWIKIPSNLSWLFFKLPTMVGI